MVASRDMENVMEAICEQFDKETFETKKETLIFSQDIKLDKKISMFDLAKINTSEIEPMTIKDYSGSKLTMDMNSDTERWKKYKISDPQFNLKNYQ